MLLPISLPTPVPANGNVSSGPVNTLGMTRGAVGLKSDQAVALSVQRYIDAAGMVPLGAAITANLTAGVAASVTWTDGAPSTCIIATVTNAGGTQANLSNIAAAVSP